MYGSLVDHTGNAVLVNEGVHDNANPDEATEEGDIEHEIKEELEALQKGRSSNSTTTTVATTSAERKQLFTHVRLNLQCGK